MYSLVLMMAVSQAPMSGPTTVVTPQPAPYSYSDATSYAPVRERRFGLFRRWRGNRRNNNYDSSPGYYPGSLSTVQPARPGSSNYRSNYPATAPQGPAPARMVVYLPPDATLTVDGSPTQATGTMRVFETPPLKPGKEYTYELTSLLRRPGGDLTSTQRVQVSPGRETDVVMNAPAENRPAPARRRLRR